MTKEELLHRVPTNKPLQVSLSCCQQFVVSRELIQKRSLDTWKQLLHIMNEQDVCHEGEPDYEHNYAYLHVKAEKVGPEPADILTYTYGKGKRFTGDQPGQGDGKYIQGIATEYLSHVIFGHMDLEWPEPGNDQLCAQFYANDLPHCAHSPCKAVGTPPHTPPAIPAANGHPLLPRHNPRPPAHTQRPPHLRDSASVNPHRSNNHKQQQQTVH